MAKEKAKLTLSDVELDAAWQARLDDASALDAGGRYGAAMAARLYALEIYLKFRVCQRLDMAHLPRIFEIHDLEALLVYTGLNRTLQSLPKSEKIRIHWHEVVDFLGKLNHLRYLPAERWTEQQSNDFAHWLAHPSEGVLPWLKTKA